MELVGAIARLARETLVGQFRHIDPREARIILLEGIGRILNTFPEELSTQAEKALVSKGVDVRTLPGLGSLRLPCSKVCTPPR